LSRRPKIEKREGKVAIMRRTIHIPIMLLIMILASAVLVSGQDNLTREYDTGNDVYVDRIRVDRYLDVEVWTDHSDGDYYVGDVIELNFRANRDAFVAIYSVDTKGRVNLLFPASPTDDNFVYGGVAYSLPGPDDDYDLVVIGPEGVENIQIIASRERFPIPDWYDVSGIICDWDDRHDFMDYINGHYFVRYDGQRFAFDRTALYVNEWEDYYFRPVYYPRYPSWTVYGNAYIDYPWGSSIYVDGIYWGITPIYFPRVYVGWHTFTVYDRWGYCWENDVHITRYHTVVLNRDIIRPQPSVMSKYKEVRTVGYRDPSTHGYPKYNEKLTIATKAGVAGTISTPYGKQVVTKSNIRTKATIANGGKRYVRGTTDVIKTSRGIETAGGALKVSKRVRGSSGKFSGGGSIGKATRSTTGTTESTGSGKRLQTGTSRHSTGSSSGSSGKRISTGTVKKNQSSGYYQKKSGSSRKQKSEIGGSKTKTKSSGSGKKISSGAKKHTVSGGSSAPKVKSSGNKKSTPSKATPSKSGSSGGSKRKR